MTRIGATVGATRPSNPGVAAKLGRMLLSCIAIVPYGIARAFLDEPLRSRPTEADETFWIVPEISFGPVQRSAPNPV